MQFVKIVFALAVAAMAGTLLVRDTPRPVQGVDLAPPASVAGLTGALRANMISPYRWLELGEGYEQAGDIPKAELCFAQAEKLGPNLPPIWIRAAAFEFRRGRKEEALRMGVRAQEISPDADDFLFQYYDGFVGDTALVIQKLGRNTRAITAYLHYMIAKNRTPDAAGIWIRLLQLGPVDRKVRMAYSDFLLRQRMFEQAHQVWFQQSGSNPSDGMFNGGFELEFSGSRLDWQVAQVQGVEVGRDDAVAKSGKFSLRAGFAGEENLDLINPLQTAVVQPGTYRFTAWLKTDNVTTNEGVRVCFCDAEEITRAQAESDALTGTHDWTEIRKTLTIPPATRLLRIGLCRHPSQKFDNKIAGTAWLDDVSLVRSGS